MIKFVGITGESLIGREAMITLITEKNPSIPYAYVWEVVSEYYRCENVYGIRADVAICQMINETGWLKFRGSVPKGRNNFAGLGATSGVYPEGEIFATVADGVEAHVQHLYAYATDSDLPSDVKLLDKRFKYVKRASAIYVHDLSMKWAMTQDYGERLTGVYEQAIKLAIRELVSEL